MLVFYGGLIMTSGEIITQNGIIWVSFSGLAYGFIYPDSTHKNKNK